jgi:hypothetical protein
MLLHFRGRNSDQDFLKDVTTSVHICTDEKINKKQRKLCKAEKLRKLLWTLESVAGNSRRRCNSFIWSSYFFYKKKVFQV